MKQPEYLGDNIEREIIDDSVIDSINNPSKNKIGDVDSVEKEITEQEKEKLIKDSLSFENLYRAISKIGIIRGTGAVYNPNTMIDLIEKVKGGQKNINIITRTYGIRDKVKDLLTRPLDPLKTKEAAAALELPKEEPEIVVAEELIGGDGPGPHISDRKKTDEIKIEKIRQELGINLPIIEPLSPQEEKLLDEYQRHVQGLYYFDGQSKEDEEKGRSLYTRNWNYLNLINTQSLEYFSKIKGYKDGEYYISSENILECVEALKLGKTLPYELPEQLQRSIESAISNEIFSDFEKGIFLSLGEQHLWELFIKYHPVNNDYLGERIGISIGFEYPHIGDVDLIAEDDAPGERVLLEGELVWCDGKIAIFKTEQVYNSIPFESIIMKNGKSYGTIKKEIEEEREHQHRTPKQRQRFL